MKAKSQTVGHKTWIEIDSRALLYNFRAIQKHVGKNVAVMAIVKANAYGHGLIEVAKIFGRLPSEYSEGNLPNIWFGVDSIDEALVLKRAGIKNPILILGYIPFSRLEEVIKNSFRFSLYDADVLKECARIAKNMKKKALAHVKIETGTFRQGILREHVSLFAKLLLKHAHTVVAEGIYTHFADTENISSSYYKEQLQMFEDTVSLFMKLDIAPRFRHAAASAAALLYPNTHFNMLRWGIGLYGLYPSEHVQHLVLNKIMLKPALCWKTCIAQIKEVPKGATVGYDRAFTASQPMKVAIIPVGYWDGYDRRLSHLGSVLIHGKKCPLVGNICMNMMMVDITSLSRVRAGDEVVLLGKQGAARITAEEVALQMGTINYEVITRINPLILRIVL